MTPAYTFCVPESFDPHEFLREPALCRLADDARYFVGLILTKLSRQQVDNDDKVRLMAKHLRNVMHKHKYCRVIDALLDGGAVTRAPYVVGERAFGYILADRFTHDKHVRVAATCPRLIGRLAAFHERAEAERRARMLPVHFGLERQQRRLRIDVRQAREIISGLPPESNPFDVQGVLTSDIEHREFHVNVGRFGRLSNNITSLKREVRAALRQNREPLAQVDVACCQPALVAKRAKKMIPINKKQPNTANRRREEGEREREDSKHASIYDAPRGTPPQSDLEWYCELVQSGSFYDYLLAQLPTCPNLTRDEVKKRFLVDVLAKRKANARGVEYPSVVEDCFRRLFPSVYRYIREVNRDGWEHAKMIRQLQREESSLVVETVAAHLLTRHPDLFVLTLHDAIFTAPGSIPLVLREFERTFDETGFPMTLKTG